ncbi:fimbria/pilus periplasmic chaperone [Pantoea ananatis]|uniref:fimbria/pilus periplasmic chaperone n=1 Tax=Pantoea ananas TaxID=553 RepID=UPI003FA44E0F
MYKRILFLLFLFPLISNAAGGIGLSATRVIFLASSDQNSISVINQQDNKRYLINAWVENSDGKKTTDFVITPPLFVSEPGTENSLRIYRNTSGFPKDRESLYWLNVKSIPAIDKKTLQNNNTLQLAVLTREKIIVRPDSLNSEVKAALDKISISRSGNRVNIKNGSPFYIAMVNIKVSGKELPAQNIPPFGEVSLNSLNNSNKISYQTVNDYGALTPVVIKTY